MNNNLPHGHKEDECTYCDCGNEMSEYEEEMYGVCRECK